MWLIVHLLSILMLVCSTLPHTLWRGFWLTVRYNTPSSPSILLNKSFRTVAFRTKISIFTSWVSKGWQKMNNLFLHILTPHSLIPIGKCQRYGHFRAYGSSFKNGTWACWQDFTPSAAANTGCELFMTANHIQILILVMWLITAINKSWRMELTKGTVWRTLSRDSNQKQSHDRLQIWNWWS